MVLTTPHDPEPHETYPLWHHTSGERFSRPANPSLPLASVLYSSVEFQVPAAGSRTAKAVLAISRVGVSDWERGKEQRRGAGRTALISLYSLFATL